MIAPKDARDVLITHLGRMGDGVVVGTDAPVYVRGALPGERVLIGRPERDGKIVRAPLLEVLSPSEARAAERCSVLDPCGGCPLGHASREAQVAAKVTWVEDALRSQGVPSVVIETALPEPARAYRTRARLAWEVRRGRATIGYRERKGAAVVAPERCLVLAPPLESARAMITARLAPVLAGMGEIQLALGAKVHEAGEGVVLRVTSSDPQPSAFFGGIEALVREGEILGASVQVGGAGVATTYGDPVERTRDVDGRVLSASAGAFRQAHVAAARELGQRVLAWARPEGADVIELHAGHGHFSLALAARARSLVAVELEPSAVRSLRDNARAHALELDARESDAARALDVLSKEVRAKKRPRPSVIVLDPPRIGAADCVPGILALRPERIVFVSCDAATFARDAAALVAGGFELREVTLVDLFPDTLHVELVARFERAPAVARAPRSA